MPRPKSGASRGVLRMLDANINRAREGLRVCEDLVRFGLGHEAHFARLRQLRYRLNRLVRDLPVEQATLVAARDSRSDAGRRWRATPAESDMHLLLINLQRVKEALRVLEEGSRLLDPRCTAGFQELRFQAYDAERALLLTVAALRHRRPRGGRPARSRVGR